MKLLALETSTDACSVALVWEDQVIERFLVLPQGHTQTLLPMCESVLQQAGVRLTQLDGIAFSRGPGAFTGVRIAVAAAQGLALGAGIPVFPVSSLAAVALGVGQRTECTRVAVALDARMREVYWGCYQVDVKLRQVSLLVPECVCPAIDVPLPLGVSQWVGAGPGWAVYTSALSDRLGARVAHIEMEAGPHARDIAHLAHWETPVDPILAQPVYLRDRVVQGG
ncbi:MAG: tRNA (adenosine(37)-N6)-threonylcarbamoyltransferase complex dimerization subunit type 1 TsaB [Gammaproteobacteria bacterium]|nr:tRNA (adenosine(37)-N6)-threonylcarbamoyltransferase complex dimerization subunit type 1 TsaB [Gammaproteobacteria bacterium]